MTLAAVYDNTLSRVRVTISDAPAAADYSKIERSTDQVTWVTVRGGDTVPLSVTNGPALNLNPFFDSGVASWTGSGGTFTASTVQAHQGTGAGLLTPDGVTAVVRAASDQVPVTAGLGYRVSVWVRCAETRAIALNVNWYSANRSYLSTSTGSVDATANAWVFGTQTFTAPTGAFFAAMTIGPSSTPPATATTYLDEAVIQQTGNGGSVDDYEFEPSVPNYYRASHVDSAGPGGVGVGAAVTGNNSSVTPPMPAGAVPGDLLLILASIRNDPGGTVNVPAGWTQMFASGNMALLGRRYVAGDVAPLVTFTGGVLNADTMAQMALWRNAELLPVASSGQLNASAQNVAWPGLTLPAAARCVLQLMWKQDDLTSVATPAGANVVGTMSSVAGDDASMYWSADFIPSPTQPSGSFVVTGGLAAISRGALVALRQADFVTQDTANLTPAMDRVWIKNLQRPYLNRAVTVTDWTDVTRPARAGVLEVVSRSMPVAVTDLRGSKRYTLTVTVPDLDQADDLDLCFSAGEPVLIHVPNTGQSRPPGMYAVIGDTTQRRTSKRTLRRYFDLPLTEVAAPAGTIVGETVLWADIVGAFATWADLVAAEPTWADVVDRIGSPTDLVTG